MRSLYPDLARTPIDELRRNKHQCLLRFQSDGFFLIDVCDQPINQANGKRQQIRAALPLLETKLDLLRTRKLLTAETKIILISRTVYDCCYRPLTEARFGVAESCYALLSG